MLFCVPAAVVLAIAINVWLFVHLKVLDPASFEPRTSYDGLFFSYIPNAGIAAVTGKCGVEVQAAADFLLTQSTY